MSREAPSGLAVAEKILGIIILIIGILLSYNTYTNIEAARLGANIFFATGIALVILGLILIIARAR